MTDPDCQLYLITPPVIEDGEGFARLLGEALGAGKDTVAAVACVQLRVKDITDEDFVALARKLQPLCAAAGAEFLLNDRVHLVRESGADGVHLGQEDMGCAEARRLLGPDATIGITCHNSRHLAMEAGEAGADYVAFGAFYPTGTKDVTRRAEVATLADWSQFTTIPCVAIGGITAENAAPLIRAGADFLAVSGAVWSHPDGPAEGVRAFCGALGPGRR